MGLKLICGPTGSGKTTRAIEAFLAALDDGRQAAFIAPSYPDARHFQRQILAERPVVGDGDVTTFESLCLDLLRQSGEHRDLRLAGEAERRLLLRLAVESQRSELSFLRGSSSSTGFIAALERLVMELEGAGIAPHDLATAATGIITPNELNTDIFHLYEEYQGILRQHQALDRETAQRQALSLLRRDPASFPYRVMIVDGFRDFTPLQQDLIEAAEEAGVDLLITAPYQEGRVVYTAPAYHFDWLMKRAECVFLDPPPDDGRGKALIAIDQRLFEDDDGTHASPDPAGSVYVLEGAGVRGQADMVAAEILRLWRDGVKLDDITAVFPSLGPDARALAAALGRLGVPYEMPAAIPLAQTPLGGTILALVEFVQEKIKALGVATYRGRAREYLLKYLRSSLPVANDALVDEFARRVQLHDISAPRELLLQWKKVSHAGLPEAGELEDSAAAGLVELGRTTGKIAQGLVAGRIREDGLLAQPEGSRSWKADLYSLKAMARVCEEAGKSEGMAVSQAEALELLADGMRAARMRVSTARNRDCVRILDPHRVLNQRFDVVFICGLLEGQFPSLGREEPFLSDRIREKLRGKGFNLKSSVMRLEEERFLFHRTLTRARRKVYLCYPYCDNDGQERVRSLFVDEVMEPLADLPREQHRRRDISEVAYSPGEAPVTAEVLRALCLVAGERRSHKGQLPAGARKSLLVAARPAGLVQELESCLASVTMPVAAAFSHPLVHARFEELTEFSASRLEKYAECPYKYFVSYHLKPSMMKLDTYVRDRGSLAHEVLKKFFGKIKSHVYLGEADDKQLDFLREEMRRLIHEEVSESGCGEGPESVLMEFTLANYLMKLIDWEAASRGQLRPDDFEVSFGSRSDAKAGPLNIGEGLTLTGRIDRIDLCPADSRAIAIDYKMSVDLTTWQKYKERRKVQVPLYTLALEPLGYTPVGGEYYSLITGKRKGFYLDENSDVFGKRKIGNGDLLSGDAFRRLIEETRELALGLAKEIKSMRFPKLPAEDRVCGYCDFAGICRRREEPEAASQ